MLVGGLPAVDRMSKCAGGVADGRLSCHRAPNPEDGLLGMRMFPLSLEGLRIDVPASLCMMGYSSLV